MIVPIAISQNNPTRKPDFENTYGRPRIPAPMIVPVSVNVAAQNFLFILSPVCIWDFVFIIVLGGLGTIIFLNGWIFVLLRWLILLLE